MLPFLYMQYIQLQREWPIPIVPLIAVFPELSCICKLFTLPSSLKARIRFLSAAVCIWVLKFHILNLWIIDCVDGSNFCPLESLSLLPIIVASPMSCWVKEIGDPTLTLSLFLPTLNVRHSALLSWALSENTKPQLLQIISPDCGSVIGLPMLHAKHDFEVCIIMKMNLFYRVRL